MAFRPYLKNTIEKQVSDHIILLSHIHIHSLERHALHRVSALSNWRYVAIDTCSSSWNWKSHFKKFTCPDYYETHIFIMPTPLWHATQCSKLVGIYYVYNMLICIHSFLEKSLTGRRLHNIFVFVFVVQNQFKMIS